MGVCFRSIQNSCKNQEHIEKRRLITFVIAVQDDPVPQDVKDLLQGEDAELTVFLPPRESAAGVWYSYDKGDITALKVSEILLVHMINKKLTLEDFFDMPDGEQIETILDGEVITPSLIGATSGRKAEEQHSGSVGLIEGNLDACVENSVMHSIKDMLVPTGVTLPASAAPRAISTGEKANSFMSPPVLYSIVGAGGVLFLSLVAILVYCLRCAGARKKEPDNEVNISKKIPDSSASTASRRMPYWMASDQQNIHHMFHEKPVEVHYYNDGARSGFGTGSSMSHSQANACQRSHDQGNLAVSSTGDATYQHHRQRASGTGSNGASHGVQSGMVSGGNGTEPMGSYEGFNGTFRCV